MIAKSRLRTAVEVPYSDKTEITNKCRSQVEYSTQALIERFEHIASLIIQEQGPKPRRGPGQAGSGRCPRRRRSFPGERKKKRKKKNRKKRKGILPLGLLTAGPTCWNIHVLVPNSKKAIAIQIQTPTGLNLKTWHTVWVPTADA